MKKIRLDRIKYGLANAYSSINKIVYDHPVASRMVGVGVGLAFAGWALTHYKDFETAKWLFNHVVGEINNEYWITENGKDVYIAELKRVSVSDAITSSELPESDYNIANSYDGAPDHFSKSETDIRGWDQRVSGDWELIVDDGGKKIDAQQNKGDSFSYNMIYSGKCEPNLISRMIKYGGWGSLISSVIFSVKTLNPNRGLFQSEIDNYLEKDSSISDETNTEKPEAWYRGEDVMFLVKKNEVLIPIDDELIPINEELISTDDELVDIELYDYR